MNASLERLILIIQNQPIFLGKTLQKNSLLAAFYGDSQSLSNALTLKYFDSNNEDFSASGSSSFSSSYPIKKDLEKEFERVLDISNRIPFNLKDSKITPDLKNQIENFIYENPENQTNFD